MPRVKRGNKRLQRRKKILELAKGYRATKSKLFRSAKESVERGLKFAYTGRKIKKRDYRSTWIVRIGAAVRKDGLNYSRFMHGLKMAGVDIDRKLLADLAVNDTAAFSEIVTIAKKALFSDQGAAYQSA
jgi:large subunit ribosomal protein L20